VKAFQERLPSPEELSWKYSVQSVVLSPAAFASAALVEAHWRLAPVPVVAGQAVFASCIHPQTKV
jgi:H+/gluconate symporter-like permease